MRNLLFVIMLFCVAGVSLGVSIGGSLEIDKCSIKAGKPATEEDPIDFRDQIQIKGLLASTDPNVLLDDVLEDVNDIVVNIDCDDLLAPLEWTFPVNDDSYKNGKYNFARKVNASQEMFKFDPSNGKVQFTSKNLNLTGLSCPATVTVVIGDYAAQSELDEDIVNGTKKPCPPQLLMGVRNTMMVKKAKAKVWDQKSDKDSFNADGYFSVVYDPNMDSPVIVELGDQTFTVAGDAFDWNKSGTMLKCKKTIVQEPNSVTVVSAAFNFLKGTYKLQIKNATIDNPSDPNGVVDFSIDCLGNELPVQKLEMPQLKTISDHVFEIEMSLSYDYGWGKTLDANSVPESYQFDAWMRVDDTVVSGTVKTPEGVVYPAKWEGSDDDDANDVSTEWLGVDAWETTLEGLSDFTEGVYIFTVTYENGKSESTPVLYALEDGSPIPDVNEPPIIVYPVHDSNDIPLDLTVELNPNGLSNPVWTYGIEWFAEEDEDEDSAAGSGWLDDLPYDTVSIQLSDLLPNTLYEIELTADHAIRSTNVDGIPYVIDKDSEAEIYFTTGLGS